MSLLTIEEKLIMPISEHIRHIAPSGTFAIANAVNNMRLEGYDVIGFVIGEPDFETPAHIRQAGIEAIEKGYTHYSPTAGLLELKKAIAKKLKQDNNLDYDLNQIIVSCGAKQSIFNIIISITDPGDEIIVPIPYWVSYTEQVKFAGGKPVFLETTSENDYKITPEQLNEAITPNTRAIILNSPSNPTGMIYTREELEAIAEIIIKHKIYCIADEIYEKIIYDDNEHISIASLGDEIKKWTLVVNGVSKAYAMTGWRVGYCAGDKDVIKAMGKIQGHTTSGTSTISQYASITALNGGDDCIKEMLSHFDKRRRYIVERLNAIKGIKCLMPEGAFYAFPDISYYLDTKIDGREINNSLDFCNYILKKHLIACIPGSAFGSDNNVRFSYACSIENIEKGLDRFEEGCKKIREANNLN